MSISSDPKVVKDYIQPQFDHYFWKSEDENYLRDAMNFWEE